MALPKNTISELIAMQSLCDEIQNKTKNLLLSRKVVASLQKDIANLSSFYQKKWLKIHDDVRLDKSDRSLLEAHVQENHYCILCEDTIWDALREAEEAQRKLIKTLAKGL